MRVAVVSRKGGSAKTTTATNLAISLSRHGDTLLVDADEQGSAITWARSLDRSPFVFAPGVYPDLERRLAVTTGFAHVVIDTPPSDVPSLRSAVRAVSTVIVPLAPSLIEIDRLRTTLQLIYSEASPGIAVRVLLTRVRWNTLSLSATRQVLREWNLSVFAAEIPLREAIAQGFGTSRHWPEYQALAEELLASGTPA